MTKYLFFSIILSSNSNGIPISNYLKRAIDSKKMKENNNNTF